MTDIGLWTQIEAIRSKRNSYENESNNGVQGTPHKVRRPLTLTFGDDMKKIFTDPSVVPCDLLRGILEGRGIKVLIKNELGSAGAGAGNPVPTMSSLTFAWPEVWVADEDAQVALEIVGEMKGSEAVPDKPWICSHCGETVDAEYAVCWNCETPRTE